PDSFGPISLQTKLDAITKFRLRAAAISVVGRTSPRTPTTTTHFPRQLDSQEAQQTLEIAEANLRKAEGKRQIIEANLALRRARTRVEVVNAIS
ncbi:hypothetical protein ABFS83_05G109000, partial [Erythranthe nasuta]